MGCPSVGLYAASRGGSPWQARHPHPCCLAWVYLPGKDAGIETSLMGPTIVHSKTPVESSDSAGVAAAAGRERYAEGSSSIECAVGLVGRSSSLMTPSSLDSAAVAARDAFH